MCLLNPVLIPPGTSAPEGVTRQPHTETQPLPDPERQGKEQKRVPLLTCINSCCCTYPSVTPSWIRARKPVIWTRWSPGVWSCKASNKPNPQVWPKVRPWQLQTLSQHCHDISAPSINILPLTSTSLGKDKNSYLLISTDFALSEVLATRCWCDPTLSLFFWTIMLIPC